jgi:predicted RNase H-like HicB family nuclease
MAAATEGMTVNYFVIAERGKGPTWWLSFPGLPGVFSSSEDPGDIVSEAQDALGTALDAGLKLPPSVEQGAMPPDLADFEQPAFVLLIPFVVPPARLAA